MPDLSVALIREAADVERAVARAYAALAVAAAVPTGRRAEILLAVAAGLKAAAEPFAEAIVAEVDKPVDLARAEVARAAATFEAAAYAAGAGTGELRPLDFSPGYPAREALVRRVPAGVVLAVTPFNFPLNLVAHKAAPAIAAGCPLILKPALHGAIVAARLVRLVHEAGWPVDAMQILPLADDALAAPMLADARIRVFTFTGSAAVGWRLRDLAHKKTVGLELGGDAFAVVHEYADLAFAAARIAFGAYAFAGQACISVQHVLVHRAVREAFEAAFVQAVDSLRVGDPRTSGVVCGPLLRDRDADRVTQWCADAVRGGARVVRDFGRDGRLLGPKILTDVPADAALATEEVFGPVADLAVYDDAADVVRRINDSKYGLQAGVFTRDHRFVKRLFSESEIGGLIVDDVPTLRFDAMPYGGMRGSGLLREGPAYALEWMTERKTLVW